MCRKGRDKAREGRDDLSTGDQGLEKYAGLIGDPISSQWSC